jgi:hypothetical protein
MTTTRGFPANESTCAAGSPCPNSGTATTNVHTQTNHPPHSSLKEVLLHTAQQNNRTGWPHLSCHKSGTHIWQFHRQIWVIARNAIRLA